MILTCSFPDLNLKMFNNRLGGNEPLDYISLYNNPGDPKEGIPPHWHYVSFGLSDLYGDCRVHRRLPNQELSGFGFELTFRLKKENAAENPPTWPANILQSLAKYVFHTSNIICAGDHVSENKPLDDSDSKIQHMLMTIDPKLNTVLTPLGKVTFIQIVGVTNDELKASQQWNVNGMIELMKKMADTGGELLVTDMRRQYSIFELNKTIRRTVEQGINQEGSNLSCVSAKCSFKPRITLDDLSSDEDNTSSIETDEEEDDYDEEEITSSCSEGEIKNEEGDKLIGNEAGGKQLDSDIHKLEDDLAKIAINKETPDKAEQPDRTVNEQKESSANVLSPNQAAASNCESTTNKTGPAQPAASGAILSPRNIISPKSECSSSMSVSHENQNQNCNSSMSYSSETGNELVNPLKEGISYLKEVHIFLNLEAGLLLPLVLKGRLKHNHHFTYKSTELAITFLTTSVSGDYLVVTKEKPFGYYGSWLQILLSYELMEKMLKNLVNLEEKLHVSWSFGIQSFKNNFF